MSFLFTSESVSEGHPDKICDQISDAVLDAALSQDPDSRVACECFTTTGMVLIGGEVRTKAQLDIQTIARDTLKKIGYTNPDFGIDADTCAVLVTLHEQSADIAQGVDEGDGLHQEQGAGDQGLMFGYACKQTESYMPLPIDLSHQLMAELARVRKSGELTYLRPDSKAQVTVEYDDQRQPKRVQAVVISTQHSPDVAHETIREDMINKIIQSVIPAQYLDENTQYFINPTGRFVIGGPHGDAGLTGRKIVVDTYGGWVPHGGGAFSGKDASKVDRSAAYMTRYVAKNLVAAGLADELQIQLAYAIGVAEPVSIRVESFGTATISEEQLLTVIREEFDLTPAGIIQTLELKQPHFSPTAAYGHFGRTDVQMTWEVLDRVSSIQARVRETTAVSS
ncbi:methionine adenosyltransferase [bacterium]|jgi:S-adenosylmethionine synthetase|nr:methionine adenosyltransferase [bacterium]